MTNNPDRNLGKITKLIPRDIRSMQTLSGDNWEVVEIFDKDNNRYRMEVDEILKIVQKARITLKVRPAKKYNRVYVK